MGLTLRSPMLALIASNMVRHKARTLATAVGIGLGVGTIVALLSVGAGLKQAAGELIHLGRADLGVFQSGVQDPTASVVPVSLARRLERRPDVSLATPLLLIVSDVKQSPAAIAFGIEPRGFVARRLVMTSGSRDLGPGKILVGDRLAGELHLRPGSKLTLKHRTFTVAGVYHSGIFFQDSGATLSLGAAQRLAHRAGEATTIAVQLANGVTEAGAEREIRRALPGMTVIGSADDPARIGTGGELVRTAVDVIAALALIVGGLGVSNTMAMAVLERERELALLNAVGVGAVVTPRVTPLTVLEALLIGIAIGVLGGLYPAWRGVTVPPTRLLSAG
jgi:putative ABC transport system permease protein